MFSCAPFLTRRLCLRVFSDSARVKQASTSRTWAPGPSSQWVTSPRIAMATTPAWLSTSWERPTPACLWCVSNKLTRLAKPYVLLSGSHSAQGLFFSFLFYLYVYILIRSGGVFLFLQVLVCDFISLQIDYVDLFLRPPLRKLQAKLLYLLFFAKLYDFLHRCCLVLNIKRYLTAAACHIRSRSTTICDPYQWPHIKHFLSHKNIMLLIYALWLLLYCVLKLLLEF